MAEMNTLQVYNGKVPAHLSIMDTHISDKHISTMIAPLIVLSGEEAIPNHLHVSTARNSNRSHTEQTTAERIQQESGDHSR